MVELKVIAVDFDGCICTNEYPYVGKVDMRVVEQLLYGRSQGAKLILWACRSGKQLDDAIATCEQYGLYFDAINDNIPELIERYGDNPRKVSATEYWDDRGVRVVAYN